MKKQGLDFEKLKNIQDKFDKEKKEIEEVLAIKLNTIGGLIYEKLKINPNPQQFINWYLDNYYRLNKKSNQSKFSDDILLEYCFLYKEELEGKINYLVRSENDVDLKNKVRNTFSELFQYDDFITEKENSKLIEEALLILKNSEIPNEILPLYKKDIGSKNTYLRYCYYKVQSLLGSQNITVWIEYIHKKFPEHFKENYFDSNNIRESTTYKKFSQKPKNYPKG